MIHSDRSILLVNVRQNAVTVRTGVSNSETEEMGSIVNIKQCIFGGTWNQLLDFVLMTV